MNARALLAETDLNPVDQLRLNCLHELLSRIEARQASKHVATTYAVSQEECEEC